ncbi:MurR/RpiR family transcriptional regulator [Vibrio quintilis]|uniref:Putative DNA-binding transcriptional regulator n=1 Tax=Vibrio quintilis TaxID=1117707 RepID=A0A1M7YW63_9VIBR|nr:MurR/RpiR family transcriptional regulator [Vibrio quintilis]SHO56864.1 putative DNA-binding transcriptional regulator [Vibrio quintilis]
MTNHHSLSERITQHYPRLTESSRRVADFLQFHPEKILMLSTAEIAEACSVSKTSVSRFIRQMGYDDHPALRRELMQEREQGVPVLTSGVDDPGIQHEIQALEQLSAQLAAMDVAALVAQIVRARRVKVIGYRNSYPLAMHFRQQLMQCRTDVDLLPLPGQTLGEDLVSVTEDDFVVLFGIRRRISQFERLIAQLKGKPCLLITDQSGQKYAGQVAHVIFCHFNNQAPLDSYAVPMSLISYLVNQVYRYAGQDAAKLSRSIARSYSELDELES